MYPEQAFRDGRLRKLLTSHLLETATPNPGVAWFQDAHTRSRTLWAQIWTLFSKRTSKQKATRRSRGRTSVDFMLAYPVVYTLLPFNINSTGISSLGPADTCMRRCVACIVTPSPVTSAAHAHLVMWEQNIAAQGRSSHANVHAITVSNALLFIPCEQNFSAAQGVIMNHWRPTCLSHLCCHNEQHCDNAHQIWKHDANSRPAYALHRLGNGWNRFYAQSNLLKSVINTTHAAW
jgi:hypothetical protein